MTLRGVIQGLLRGSNDAEAMLADDGYGDLPAEMFGQALSSYADTAPMAEADALSPVLTGGDASDVFAVLEEQPLTLEANSGPDAAGLGASLLGVTALDDVLDEASDEEDLDDIDSFGTAAPEDDTTEGDDNTADLLTNEESDASLGEDETSDPFASDDLFETDDVIDSAAEFEQEADFFDTEPEATGEDPSDLDF